MQEELRQQKMDVDGDRGSNLKAKKSEAKQFEPYSFPDDPGSNNSGFYELKVVLKNYEKNYV